jgi:putative endonuclease
MALKNKRKSYRFGLYAEELAAWFLRAKGYQIVEWRHRNKLGEIDLVAKKGKTIVMVEVKARAKNQDEVVHRQQQERISRAAALFVAKRKEFANLSVRFDVIKITPWQWPKHIKNAWEYGGF